MRRFLAMLVLAPLVVAAKSDSNVQAVRTVLASISAGEDLPEEILDRQTGHPDLPDLDQSLARAKGCLVSVMDRLQTGNFGVQWRCKGRKRKDMPSALIIYVAEGRVTKITTAVMM